MDREIVMKNVLRVVGVLAISMSSLAVSPVSATTAKLSWHTPTRIAPPLGETWSIACTTDTCFAATSTGLLQSTDHAAWTRSTSSVLATSTIDEISCDAHGSTCEAFTQQGASFITANNGATWSKGVSLSSLVGKNYLNGVTCVANGFCVAHYGPMFGKESFARATLSGATLGTWTKLTTPTIYGAGGINCPTTTNCIVGGNETSAYSSKSELLLSRNGGLTWTKSTAGSFTIATLNVTCAADGSALCLATGNSKASQLASAVGFVLSSTDYGVTWHRSVLANSVSDFQDAVCVTSTNCLGRSGAETGSGFFATQYTTVQSTDGGVTWTAASSLPTSVDPSLITCANGHGCFLILNESPISIYYSSDFSSWSSTTFPLASTDVYGTTCVTSTVCFTTSFPRGGAANSPLEVYESTNGGSTWVYRSTLPDWMLYVRQISCLNTTTCVAIGSKATGDATILRTSDAGSTWSAMDLGALDTTKTTITGVSCVAAHCVVAGYLVTGSNFTDISGVLLDSTDAGSTWRSVSVTLNGAFRDVSCATATACIAVGSSYPNGSSMQPVVFGSSDGATWTLRSTGTKGGAFTKVSCTSVSNCVYAGIDGNYNFLLAYSTSGMTFTSKTYKNSSGTYLSCRVTLCLAGLVSDSTDKPTYLVSTNSGKTFATQTPTDKSLQTDSVSGVTCASETFCLGTTASGSFTKFSK